MELRSWISNRFGSTETFLDKSKYSDDEIKEDKIRLRQERKRIQKELNNIGAEYQTLLEKGAQANEMERKQYAQQAKIAKKKYKIKQQQYQKNSVETATIVTIEGARELMEMSNKDTTNFQEIVTDSNVDLSHVQESVMNTMVEFELDMDMMMEVQDALDIDIIGADVDMGASKEEEMMEDIAAGKMDAEQVDVESEAQDEVEDPIGDDLGGFGGPDLNAPN